MRGEGRRLLLLVEVWNDGEGRTSEVVRRCSYLGVEEVWDWVLSKEDLNLEEGAGTIWRFQPSISGEVNLARTFRKALKDTFPGSSGALASGGTCVLKVP